MTSQCGPQRPNLNETKMRRCYDVACRVGSYISIIFTSMCSRIENIIFFAYKSCRIFTFTLTFIVIPILVRVTFSTIEFTYTFVWYICLVNIFDIFVPVIILNTFRFKYSVLFGTHILLDRSLRVLQIPVHLTTQQPFNYHLPWWKRLEDVFRLRLQKMSSRRLDQGEYIRLSHTSSEDVFKTSWSRPIYSSWSYVFKVSSRSFQDIFQTSCKNAFKTFSGRIIS